jgi:hypothetical protein
MIRNGFHAREAVLVGTAVLGLTFAGVAGAASKPDPMNGLHAKPNPMNGLRLHGKRVHADPHNWLGNQNAT